MALNRQKLEWIVFWIFFTILSIIAVLGIYMVYPTKSYGAEISATLTWDPNPEPDIAGYKVRWRAEGSTTYFVTDVGLVTSVIISALPEAKTYFSGLAYDTFGQESEWSVESAQATKPVVPKTMGGLKVKEVRLVR